MRKLFLKFSMLMFALICGVNIVKADVGSLPPEMAMALAAKTYCARLTGNTSTTGGGKVYVTAPAPGESSTEDPRVNDWTEGDNVAVNGMGVSMTGLTKIGIIAWAKADPGYWFVGWSYANMGTDLGTKSDDSAPEGMYSNAYDVATAANETVDYVIYATFEPIRIAEYAISGDNTTDSRVCSQTVSFSIYGTEIDAADFKAPVITSSEGGGSWTSSDGDAWTTSDLTIDGNTISLVVKFTAPSDDPAEYSANMVLETQAGVKINVPLNARTKLTGVEAIRYNKAGVQQEQGVLATLLGNAATDDVIKLNSDYASAVTIDKSITFDINGYTLSAALTVNGSNVTLAYSPYKGTITGNISVAKGAKLTLIGGTINGMVTNRGTLEQNGATISGGIDNYGTMTTTNGVHSGVLTNYNGATLTINGGSFQNAGSPITNNGTALIKKGTITSIGSYAVFTQQRGNTTIEKLAAISGSGYDLSCVSGGKVTVNCGKFTDPNKLTDGTITFNSAYFQTNYSDLANVQGKHVWRNTSGAEFREGYEFFAGDIAAAQTAGVSVCHIGGTSYSKLEDALAYANTTNELVTIIMDNDYTLPAGYYTLPSNATLLVPMSNDQGAGSANVNLEYSWERPSLFRKLTFENGVNMNVSGTIEISGSQLSYGETHTGATTGKYAQLQLNQGSKITLQNGSILRAWGYVTGDIEHQDAQHNVPTGEIDARRGSTVYELFQMGDWGNTVMNAIGLVTSDTRFPITQYYIQNIESPVKYHPGSHLIAQTTVSESAAGLSVTMCANDIKIVGVSPEVAMFLMNPMADAENTWVRKWYDASKDQQVYEINSGAHIGNLVINLASSPLFEGLENTLASQTGTLGSIGKLAQNMGAEFHQDLVMNSGQYVLPITSNFKLHLLSGSLDFTQNTELIPGSELEIDKEATVYVTDQDDPNVLEGSLYFYDWQDWVLPARKIQYSPVFDDGVNNGEVPDAVRDVSSIEALGHAVVNVHGTFDTQDGFVFTSEHGGNIFSSVEDAGTFMFTTAAKEADYYEEVKTSTSTQTNCYSAFLKNSAEWVANGGDAYVQTGGTAAGQSYCYLDVDGRGGHWTNLEQRGCFTYDAGNDIYYIKPQEYVAVSIEAVWDGSKFTTLNGNSDHTFSDADGAGRLFINLGNGSIASECQWWEVEQKDNFFHCIHPENDTYYEWDNTKNKWKEVRLTITWNDYDGSTITTYSVPYGTQAEWLSNNPTRDADIDYTYDFIGWAPALGAVTNNVTYTATYEKKQIKYTIIFEGNGGVEIERHLLARNEVPVCENTPTQVGFTLQWEPEIAAVTGNQTYKATWLKNPPTEYEVTFFDYDGETVLQRDDVPVGDMPEYTEPTPAGKSATSEYNYVFDHWSPAIEEVSATSIKSYTAVYREVPKTYLVIFQDENGSEIERHDYTYGETPICSAMPTKVNTAQYTYSFAWTPEIQSVVANATYRAVFTPTTNKYTVSVKCSPSGAATVTGSGIYNYGEPLSISKVDNENYSFDKWTDGNGSTISSLPTTVTGNIEIVANYTFEGPGYTITWKSEDGATTLKEVNQKNGTATTYTGATPTKPATAGYTYAFDGWTTAANGKGTFYKNGMTPKATKNATYYAHFAATAIPNLEVAYNGVQVLTEPVTYQNLVLTSNGTTSSQLLGQEFLTLTGNAYFDLAINAQNHKWYAIAVPWQVDVKTGISVNGRMLQFGKNFDILYYDGAQRAAQGTENGSNWKYMETEMSEANWILHPGKLYMIGLTFDAPVIRFAKKAGAEILTTTTSVSAYSSSTATDAGWNGIANPAIFHAYVNAGVPVGQLYNASKDGYDAITLSSTKLVLGQPVFVQVSSSKNPVTVSHGGTFAAPRRVKEAETTASYDIRLAPKNANYTDRLFVEVDADKEADKYIIGQDLVKMGVSNKVAQMWINRYDAKLCMNTLALVNGVAEYPLGISAPQAGEYTIGTEQSIIASDYDLYLTYNGEAIWNLSKGAYTLNLNSGTTNEYGLRVNARTPQISTGFDEVIVDSKEDMATKVLMNNQVFIIRGDKIYTIDGRMIK